MLSHHGGKCTESTLPCRDFGLHSWQEGHLMYFRQPVGIIFFWFEEEPTITLYNGPTSLCQKKLKYAILKSILLELF